MINVQIQPEHIRGTAIVFAVLCLVIACCFGFFAGRDLARADLAIAQANSIAAGLRHFYADQDRFPSTLEFADRAVFGVYAGGIPLHMVSSKTCPETIGYESLTLRTFSVTYCIPRAVGDLLPGVHEITNRDVGI